MGEQPAMSDLEAALSTYLASSARGDNSSHSAAAGGTASPIPSQASLNVSSATSQQSSSSPSSSSSSSGGGPSADSIIFDYGEITVLAAFYGITFVLGLLSNIAMLYVILGE